MKRLPLKLKKEPLVEAVFEVRFESAPMLANLLLSHLLSNLGQLPVHKMPAADIPEQFRNQNQAFLYQPLFRVIWKQNLIFIGDKMCAVTADVPYPGWIRFKESILEITNLLKNFGQLTKIKRYSLKYVDLLEAESVKEQLNFIDINLKLGEFQIKDNAINLRVELKDGMFMHGVQLVSSTILENQDKSIKKGILLSIDSMAKNLSGDFWDTLPKNLEKVHESNKKLFFGFLKDQTIYSLEPTYDDK